MDSNLKHPNLAGQTIFLLIITGFFLVILLIFEPSLKKVEANNLQVNNIKKTLIELNEAKIIFIQGNTIAPILISSNSQPETVQKIKVIITGYSSSVWETDSSPYLTAAGTKTREGIVANNFLAFGTKVRIPELFGERIFVVEDRMNPRKEYHYIDIWFPSYWEAKNFGVKTAYLEILED